MRSSHLKLTTTCGCFVACVCKDCSKRTVEWRLDISISAKHEVPHNRPHHAPHVPPSPSPSLLPQDLISMAINYANAYRVWGVGGRCRQQAAPALGQLLAIMPLTCRRHFKHNKLLKPSAKSTSQRHCASSNNNNKNYN